jgi:hypothetical protein
MRFLPFIVACASVCPLGLAQYFPPVPKGVSTLLSKLHPGVSISYKEVSVNHIQIWAASLGPNLDYLPILHSTYPPVCVQASSQIEILNHSALAHP